MNVSCTSGTRYDFKLEPWVTTADSKKIMIAQLIINVNNLMCLPCSDTHTVFKCNTLLLSISIQREVIGNDGENHIKRDG